MTGRCSRLVGRCAAAAIIVAALVIPVAAVPALASVSNSQNLPPVYSNWPKNPTNWPCYATPSYACTQGGYDNSSALASGWPNKYYGQGEASTNSYGMHNCTLYAAYRLAQNGFKDPGNWGNASNWAKAANSDHILVNQTPAVGSIAQWNVGAGGLGHVAYVESVSYNGTGAVMGITITEDNYMPETGHGALNGGYTAEIYVTAGAPVWPANFIHAKDQSSSPWTVTPMPNPQTDSFFKVAAVSSSDAWAIGGYRNSANQSEPVLAQWNGSSWQQAATPSPAGGTGGLADVSAPTAQDVWAVGSQGRNNSSWVLHYDGTGWHTIPATGMGTLVPSLVVALSPSNVWVAGSPNNSPQVEVAHWNGTSWTRPALPSLACPYFSSLASVPGTSQVLIAGQDLCREPQVPVALRWNGTSWAVMHMTSSKILGQISGVTALSATNIWADGIQYPDNDTEIAPLLEHWDGTTWTIVTAPGIGKNYGTMESIANDGPDDILAVGSQWCTGSSCPNRTLALQYNGTNWAVIPTPDPAVGPNGNTFSTESSIPGTTQFWAVGDAGGYSLAALYN
jgi:surface antigen